MFLNYILYTILMEKKIRFLQQCHAQIHFISHLENFSVALEVRAAIIFIVQIISHIPLSMRIWSPSLHLRSRF
jgi:hypothetical protein